MFVYRTEDPRRYVDNGGARFQRSQSQNDLDRKTFDDQFYGPSDVKSSASGFNIQQRDADKMLRRHPSDGGAQYRRSYGEWDGARMSQTAVGANNIPQVDDLHQRMDQNRRPPHDLSRDLESPRRVDREDPAFQRDYDVRRLHSTGDEFPRSREDMGNVTGVNKKPSVRDNNPKNQDIIDWLKRGDAGEPQPHDSDYNHDGRDISRSGSDRTGDKLGGRTEPSYMNLSPSRPYPPARNDGELLSSSRSLTSGPRADKEDTGFLQFGVSNPMYEAGRPQTQSSDSSVRANDAVSQHQGYNWPDRGLRTFSNNRYQPSSNRPDSNQSPGGMGHASPGYQQIAPVKPVHKIFTDPPSAHGLNQSADLPGSFPPKLANQQAPPKPAHVSPSRSDDFQRPVNDSPRSPTADHQLQRMKDDVSEKVNSAAEYAVVYKRPVQSTLSDYCRHDKVDRLHRPSADGAGYSVDIASKSRQSPDGTIDSSDPHTSGSKSAGQLLAVSVTSSSDFGKDQRPAMKASSVDSHPSITPGRPTLPSEGFISATENLSAPSRSEPQGGSEPADHQVNVSALCFAFLQCIVL